MRNGHVWLRRALFGQSARDEAKDRYQASLPR
jgi:hypothetical protein